MSGQDFITQLQNKFGDKITGQNLQAIDPWLEVSPEGLRDVCLYLKNDSPLKFDFLNCISAVDFLETDPKKVKKADFEPHTQVVYHLYSMSKKVSLVLKVILPRWKNDIEGSLPEVPTVSDIWRTADWHEREVFDLSGINFTDHPDLRRILCPEDWVGYPLRKDYEMPLEYHGIRGR